MKWKMPMFMTTNDSFAKLRIGQMEKKTIKDKIITHECNVLTNILNYTKHSKSKYDNYRSV